MHIGSLMLSIVNLPVIVPDIPQVPPVVQALVAVQALVVVQARQVQAHQVANTLNHVLETLIMEV